MTAHKFLRPVLLIAGVLIFPAMAANVVNTVMTVSETDFDPCTNEDVNLVGNVHLVANMTFNDNTAHIIGEANEHLEGTGASSGASYLANATAHVEFNLDIDPASETGSVTLALSTAQLIGVAARHAVRGVVSAAPHREFRRKKRCTLSGVVSGWRRLRPLRYKRPSRPIRPFLGGR